MRPHVQGDRGSPRLVIGAREITLPGPIHQAISWDQKECVVVLLRSPETLLVFGWDGRLVRTFLPPVGFELYYMQEHPRVGVSIVCVAAAPVDGWQDWQFAIDLETGSLERFSPFK